MSVPTSAIGNTPHYRNESWAQISIGRMAREKGATAAPGIEILIPLRVTANGSGSEVTLTLFRLPG